MASIEGNGCLRLYKSSTTAGNNNIRYIFQDHIQYYKKKTTFLMNKQESIFLMNKQETFISYNVL